ncbi:MAG: hypothetical protein ACPG73_04935 [Candidatus Poseidoniaceae archaeon]
MDEFDEFELYFSDKTLHFPANGWVHMIGFFLLIAVVAFGSFFLFTAYISDIPVSEIIFGEILPFWLIPSVITYLCFSYRIGINRDKESITVWKEFLLPRFKYSARSFPIETLSVEERIETVASEDMEGYIVITTLHSNDQEVMTYPGHKKAIEEFIPELLV